MGGPVRNVSGMNHVRIINGLTQTSACHAYAIQIQSSFRRSVRCHVLARCCESNVVAVGLSNWPRQFGRLRIMAVNEPLCVQQY